jgi:dihydroxy-acid dehydratase
MACEARSLRSAEWFGKRDRDGLTHRSGVLLQGFTPDVMEGLPVIGIANSWSELTPCNAHLRTLAEAVKRGVWQAGGFPLEFPTMSLGENFMRPTTMLFRNLMAMEVEETIRANPLDGVVLLAGCDKTTPAQLMGALSVDLPTIVLTGGPQLTGQCGGRATSPTDVWRTSEASRSGHRPAGALFALEGCGARSSGHCNAMGTASTMACLVEAMGLQLPGGASLPAPDSRRLALAQFSGKQIVRMVEEGLQPSRILTREAFENAIRALAALGGSSNAVIHLLALAGRVGVPLTLDDFEKIGREVPTLVNVEPSGRFFMEDFAYAGGMQSVMWALRDVLHTHLLTVNGKTVGDNLLGQESLNKEVVTDIRTPLMPAGTGTAILRGNLCPDGAVIKQSAASPHLMTHRGRALVFDRVEDYNAIRDDDSLAVDEDTVLIVRNAGPCGYPGMPEIGNLQLPRALLRRGITDMVRITDGRMSGTAYGTVVLHVAPEAAIGGPLAMVRTGDVVHLDVPSRRLNLEVHDEELESRQKEWAPPATLPATGYTKLYADCVLQADRGVDFDFLVGCRGHAIPRESH